MSAQDRLTQLARRRYDRRTVENVAAAGLTVERVTDLSSGIFKLIEARKS